MDRGEVCQSTFAIALGREADAAIDVARKQVDEAIGLHGGRIAFTGGATEALNWALKGTLGRAEGETALSPLPPSMRRCWIPASGWKAGL
nr:hypothetical protein [Sphingomonas daechungensis]